MQGISVKAQTRIITLEKKTIFQNVEEGVQTTIYLATSKDVEDKSGRFFDECKEHSYYWNVNEDLAEQLWFKTQKLLQFNHN